MVRLVFAPSAITDARDILATPRLGAAIRIAVVRPYVVIYRATSDTVEVMRVLHGRRKITRRVIAPE